MDRAIRHMQRRQVMVELELGQRSMLVPAPIGCLVERMRMDDRRPMLDMDVHEQGYATVVGDKNHRQQPLYIFDHPLFHPFHFWTAKDTTNLQNQKLYPNRNRQGGIFRSYGRPSVIRLQKKTFC